MPRSLPVAGAPLAGARRPPALLVAELQDALHRGRHGGPLAAGEAAEAADDGVGVLVLEVSGEAGELPERALALPLVDRRVCESGSHVVLSVVSHLSETLGLTRDRNTPSMV